jgi:hydrid cluster protein-associated redox disulfide domain
MWVSVFGTHIINSLLKEVENMSEQKITKDMIIADIIKVDENLIPVLLNAGMHCVGCPSSLGETLEEAAEVHGIDADELCDLLNEFVD